MVIEGDILIVGQNACARAAGRLLARNGSAVILATVKDHHPDRVDPLDQDFEEITCLDARRLVSCDGHWGGFALRFDTQNGSATCHVKCVLVTSEAVRRPNFDVFGLLPSERVHTLTEMESLLCEKGAVNCFKPAERVLLLNRWLPDAHPTVAVRMLKLCLRIQRDSPAQTHFVTGNLKVSMKGMEQVFQDAKAAGALFLRSTDAFPSIKTLADGRVEMDYHDEVARSDFYLTADKVIVDESLEVPPEVQTIGKILRLDIDPAGFLQRDNVHRLTNETNRRGIFVAGAARQFLSPSQVEEEAKRGALKVMNALRALDENATSSSPADSDLKEAPPGRDDIRRRPSVDTPSAVIDQDACARCLTCYRLCPYSAIDTSPKMDIHPGACRSCGLCQAGCPSRAIHIDGGQLGDTIDALFKRADGSDHPDGDTEPANILSFCCQRSASQARAMALCMGHRLPAGMVVVEGICGGALSVYDILRSFDAGADGVMVMTCHEGNCHSQSGTRFARKRVSEAKRALSLSGISAERIRHSTMASNMAHAFVLQTAAFAKKIDAVGKVWAR